MWTTDKIVTLLATNDRAVLRAVIALFKAKRLINDDFIKLRTIATHHIKFLTELANGGK